jgi:apolipoprotein N-acyltransferase
MPKPASIIPKIAQYLENPVPYLHEAHEAASRVLQLQGELLTLKAEHAAMKQGKRIAYGGAAGFSAILAIGFCFAWVTISLHESGVHSNFLAVISFVFFAVLSAALALLATKKGA